jgi:hypothetical protein
LDPGVQVSRLGGSAGILTQSVGLVLGEKVNPERDWNDVCCDLQNGPPAPDVVHIGRWENLIY